MERDDDVDMNKGGRGGDRKEYKGFQDGLLEEKTGEYKISIQPRSLKPFYQFQWLDVKDSEGSWLEAQVMETDEKQDRIFVHYKGWKPKYDEWLSVSTGHPHNARIALLHTHTNNPGSRSQIRFRISDRVMVRDTSENVLPAAIADVDVSHQMIKIHYDSWNSKYDEWINMESYRVTPVVDKPPPASASPAVKTHNPRGQETKPTLDTEEKFQDKMKKIGLSILEQASDGNCLFRSISHQVYGDPEHHAVVRAKCVDYIESEAYFFRGYIAEDFKPYCDRMRISGVWGDHVEIQAMAELYDRTIEIYAYSTEPIQRFNNSNSSNNNNKTKNTVKRPLIRLSYHCQSHYNSVVGSDHPSSVLRSTPGVIEDEQIKKSALRSPAALNAATKLSDLEATELSQVRTAIEESRKQFQDFDFNSAVQDSITSFTEKEMAEAQQRSMEEFEKVNNQKMQEAINVSKPGSKGTVEDLVLQRVLADSKALADSKTLAGSMTDKKDNTSVGKSKSETDDIAKAVQMSLAEKQPPEIQKCMEVGYPLDLCVQAYSVCAHLGKDHVLDSMLAYIMDHMDDFR